MQVGMSVNSTITCVMQFENCVNSSDGGLYTDRTTISSGVDIFTATISQATLIAIY